MLRLLLQPQCLTRNSLQEIVGFPSKQFRLLCMLYLKGFTLHFSSLFTSDDSPDFGFHEDCLVTFVFLLCLFCGGGYI